MGLCVWVSMGWGRAWMGVVCPCPPVRNDIVTPRHLFLHILTRPLRRCTNHPLPNRPYLVLQLLKRKNRVAAEISELTAYHNVLWNHFRKEAVFLTYDAAPWSNWLQCLYCNICCFVSSMVAIFLRFTLHDMPPNSCTTFPAFFVYPWRFHYIKILWINWSNKNNNWQWIDKEQSPNLTRWQWLMNN